MRDENLTITRECESAAEHRSPTTSAGHPGVLARARQPALRIAMIGQKGLPATYGGIEHHVENLSLGLVALGHHVTVFCRPHYSRDLDSNTQIKEFPSGVFSYKGIDLRLLASLATKHFDAISHSLISALYASAGHFDIIHFHGIGPSLASVLPGLSGKRIVATVHALDYRQKKWGAVARLALKAGLVCALTVPRRTICVSKTLQSQFNRPDKVVYIPNGVGAPVEWGRDELDFIRSSGLLPGKYILFVGRLIEDKGCHLLTTAVNQLGGNARLVVAGDSSFTDEYVRRLKETAGPRTVFLGNVYGARLSALYSNCALFVLPSSVEGLPIVLIEAMRHMTPAVVSDIPENMEIVNGSRLPIAVPFRDQDVGSLKQALTFALSHSDYMSQVAKNALTYVEANFGWEQIVKKTEKVYFEVLDTSNRN